MGLIVETGDLDLPRRYQFEIEANRPLSQVESWALPVQSGDLAATPTLYVPSNISLPRTARAILRQVDAYNDAYLIYLVGTAIPGVLTHDPSFGRQTAQLRTKLLDRVPSVCDKATRRRTLDLITALKDAP